MAMTGVGMLDALGEAVAGSPDVLIQAVADSSATNLEVLSNNCGVDDRGLGLGRTET